MKLHCLIHDLRSKVSSYLSKNLISNLLDLSWNIRPAYRPLEKLSIKKRENLHDIIPDVPTEKRSNERRRCKFFHP
jgi:hypothetical protein